MEVSEVDKPLPVTKNLIQGKNIVMLVNTRCKYKYNKKTSILEGVWTVTLRPDPTPTDILLGTTWIRIHNSEWNHDTTGFLAYPICFTIHTGRWQ